MKKILKFEVTLDKNNLPEGIDLLNQVLMQRDGVDQAEIYIVRLETNSHPDTLHR